jgi:putative ABC transport system permease protein
MKESQAHFTLLLEPLLDVYLKSNRRGAESGNMSNVYIFSMVGVFILLIACFNFVNLTTARSSERAKEVGIRKVVGAEKFQLTKQFLSESILVCLMAFVLAVLFCALALPLFNQLSGKVVSDGIFSNPVYILILFALSVCIGIIAGIYPALVLSSFMPITVLKGRFATGTKGLLLRKGLVIAQFTISIALIIGTIVVYSQLTYMRNQDLGFNKSQMMVLDTHGDVHNKALNNEIASIRGVLSTTMSSSIPGGGAMNALSQLENKHGDMQTTGVDLYFVDYNYIPQYKIKLVAGRTFSKDFASDTTQAIIINETAVKMLGYTSAQQAIGRKFSQWGRQGKIIGVIKDFHYQSLQENIKPLSMRVEPDGVDQISINIATQNMPATIAAIQKKWERIIPYRPFNYYFVDESFDKLYRAEDRFGNLFLNFAILAIFISSLGLLGLASYSTIQRTKEIGVRKVMGATVGNITVLLSKEFVQLVFISILIASPIAWWVMANWLHGFAYRINISWWMFVAAGLLALFIALATISYQAIKAALMNPVKSLRSE